MNKTLKIISFWLIAAILLPSAAHAFSAKGPVPGHSLGISNEALGIGSSTLRGAGLRVPVQVAASRHFSPWQAFIPGEPKASLLALSPRSQQRQDGVLSNSRIHDLQPAQVRAGPPLSTCRISLPGWPLQWPIRPPPSPSIV